MKQNARIFLTDTREPEILAVHRLRVGAFRMGYKCSGLLFSMHHVGALFQWHRAKPRFALCSLLFALCSVASADGFAVAEQQLARLPEWGIIFASTLEVHDDSFSVGEMVPDDFVQGKIRIENNTKIPTSVTGVTSSCGCTVAARIDDAIPAGENHDLVVTVHKTDVGRFAVQLDVQFSDSSRKIVLTGNVRSRFSLESPVLKFDAKGFAQVKVAILDDGFVADDVSFQILEGAASIVSHETQDRNVVLGFVRDEKRTPSTKFVLAPRHHDEYLLPIVLPVVHADFVQVVPKTLHISNSAERVRVFVTGDLASIRSQQIKSKLPVKFSVRSKHREERIINASMTLIDGGAGFISLTGPNVFAILREDRYQVRAEFGRLSTNFTLRVRD